MINKDIDQDAADPEPQVKPVEQPDEHGGLVVQGFFRIVDPESGEIITQGRA